MSKNLHSLFMSYRERERYLYNSSASAIYLVGGFDVGVRIGGDVDIEPRRVQPSAYSTASWGNNKDMVSSDGSTKPLNIATGIIVHWANMNIICIFDMGVGGVKSPSFYVM